MKKLISILMSIIIIMTTFIILSVGNQASAAMRPDILLGAPNQYYIADEEITFELKIYADVIKEIDYTKIFIECNKDVLIYKQAETHFSGECNISETDNGYIITFYPHLNETDANSIKGLPVISLITFNVSDGKPDVSVHAVQKDNDKAEECESRLFAYLPNNTVFDSDEVPRLMITGDLEIFRKGDTIYLPHPIKKAELKNKIRSTHKEYPIKYKVLYHIDTEYALTGDELSLSFDGRQGETVRICILGDADNNGIVNVADARKTLRYSAGLEPFPENFNKGCDFNENGVADASDARMILRVVAQIDYFRLADRTIWQNQPLKIGPLVSASDGGYMWRCTVSEEGAIKVEEQIEQSVDNSGKEPDEIIVGAPALQTFTLTPLKQGEFEVHFELIRSWEKEPVEEFGFTMVVDDVLN